MTVKELIEKLQVLPPDMVVYVKDPEYGDIDEYNPEELSVKKMYVDPIFHTASEVKAYHEEDPNFAEWWAKRKDSVFEGVVL